mmetsp:Transcript_15709/g.47656  ORF Transcript_15709/g.47656 Transcript_15709/m.47656 type:complete len:207 (-) Transcript_15709:4044-4664(-)|eukprot:scaffold282895_cov28-Tisochrysis_lutea.AAC.8
MEAHLAQVEVFPSTRQPLHPLHPQVAAVSAPVHSTRVAAALAADRRIRVPKYLPSSRLRSGPLTSAYVPTRAETAKAFRRAVHCTRSCGERQLHFQQRKAWPTCHQRRSCGGHQSLPNREAGSTRPLGVRETFPPLQNCSSRGAHACRGPQSMVWEREHVARRGRSTTDARLPRDPFLDTRRILQFLVSPARSRRPRPTLMARRSD